MKNFKKLAVCAVAMIGLVGCSISKEEALQRTDNYSQEKAAEKYSGYTLKTVEEVKKSEGFFSTFFRVHKNESEKTYTTLPGVLTKDTVKEMEDDSNGITFKKVGSSGLGIEAKMKVDEYLKEQNINLDEGTKFDGEVYLYSEVNDYGLPTKAETKINISFKGTSSAGLTLEGALDMYSTMTYTYASK